jgi:hypothetical protein
MSARRHDFCDIHEVFIPRRPLEAAHQRRKQFIQPAMQLFQCSIIGNNQIRFRLRRMELLVGRIVGFKFARFLFDKLQESLGSVFPAPFLAALETNGPIGF